jgi:heme exporter protein D
MKQFMQWLAMGGYSLYIWPAYGLVCVVLVANLLSINFQRQRIYKKLRNSPRHEGCYSDGLRDTKHESYP